MLGHISSGPFPFALLIVLVLTTRFDHRLLEAAADLGAGPWRSVLGHRISPAAARHRRRRAVRLPAVVQRGATLHLPARHGDDDADLELDAWPHRSNRRCPIIFSLATLILAVVLPLLCLVFWLLFVRFEEAGAPMDP